MASRNSVTGPVTELLRLAAEGNSQAGDQLFRLVFGELRRIAASRLRKEPANVELEPTELVNEAYCHLFGSGARQFANRGHFLAVAGRAMHCILIDAARRRHSAKRNWGPNQVTLDEMIADGEKAWPEKVLLFEEVMQRLAQFDPRAAQIVELKVFVGATDEQVAEAVGKSIRTVKRDYKAAKAWLRAELRASAPMPEASGGTE